MNPMVLLLVMVVVILTLILLLLLVLATAQAQGSHDLKRLKALLPKQKKQRSFNGFSERVYPYMRELPIVSLLMRRARSRFTAIYAGDERVVRSKSVEVTLLVIASVSAVVLFSFLLTSEWRIRFAIIFSAIYIGSVISDMMIGRVEKKLLYGQSEFMLDLRHEYHQTHMVVESFERTAEKSSRLMAVHARQIADVLKAVDPEDELRKYYEVAPNRYMKQLAGISFNTAEYGDGDESKEGKSLFLNGLGKINEEIRMDIIRREKLDNLLGGIVFVAVAPVFMIDPLRKWGESNFPMMADYYNSHWGLYSLLLLYGLIVGCFISLRMIRGLDGDSQAVKEEGKWLRRLLQSKQIRALVERLVPPSHRIGYFRVQQQLREANSHMSIKELYTQKAVLSVGIFLFLIIAQLYIHGIIRDHLLHPKPAAVAGAGQSSADTESFVQQEQYLAQLMRELITMNVPSDRLEGYALEKLQGQPYMPTGKEAELLAKELAQARLQYERETFRWTDYLLAIAVGWGSYWIPNLLLIVRRSMRKWEMQNEVDGFYSIVGMLSGMSRISVYEILEWMHRYSYIFEKQLFRCLMDYESGSWQALERLKDEVRFPPFERIIERLQVSTELIPIKKAFDDFEQERSFAMEQRKLMYEQMVNRKASIGKLVGFLPLQATFVVYLLVPFCFMAFQQLGELNKLTGSM
ncbi:hypothetical protein [Paenibacillus turpanensis]|uniref:hypothetical protein n=1 Tax=Paenibacillus turpanensis TaxID=2689078 RepID=UPI0014084D3F|nr:hypothetical protein [Paenibacillus turpanensis]